MAAGAPTIPPTREFTFLGVTYGLFAFGLIAFWPAVVGVLLAYIRRDDAAGTFLESHYRWLIRTFWWWALLFIVITCTMAAAIVPDAVRMGIKIDSGGAVNIPWSMLATAVVGGLALAVVWFWVIYRLIRGAIRLSDGQPAP